MKNVCPWIPLWLVITACSGGGGPTDEVLRLIDQVEEATIEWPDGTSAPPIELTSSSIGSTEPAGRLAEVHMRVAKRDRDTRVALLAPTPSTYTFRVRLPRSPTLRFGTGYVREPEGRPRSIDYSVSVTPVGGSPNTILETQRKTKKQEGWSDHEIDLQAWAGREVEIAFRVEGSTEQAWAAWSAPVIANREMSPDGWDVILVSLDTLRADHLGCYGYERPTSPNLDAIAARGARFATAVSQAPWTRPSHRALLSGVYPSSSRNLSKRPIARELWRRGYRTGAFTGGGNVDSRFGFNNGFEVYKVAKWVNARQPVIEWMENGRNRNDFLFLHTFAIHDPYRDARFTAGLDGGRIVEEYNNRFWVSDGWNRRDILPNEKEYAVALYDGGIARTDEKLGALLDELERRGLMERTIVIVTSDHGEQFWEHGRWRHGPPMYDHQLLVPLLVYLPEPLRNELGLEPGTVIEQQVQLIDLYPTILDLLQLPLEHEIQGVSLRPLLEGGSWQPRPALSERSTLTTHERKAIRTAEFKFIYSYPKKDDPELSTKVQLFRLSQDPGEQVNVADEYPEFVESQLAYLRWLGAGAEGETFEEVLPSDLDPDLLERLKALGYVED